MSSDQIPLYLGIPLAVMLAAFTLLIVIFIVIAIMDHHDR